MSTPKPAPQVRKYASVLVAFLVLLGLLQPAIPARAVYNGIIDGSNRYSNVGLVFTESTNPRSDVTHGGPPNIFDDDHCNGVLIAPTLVLTAGSCVNDRWDEYAYFSPFPDFDPLYDYGEKDANGNQLPFFDGLLPYVQGDPICNPATCVRGVVIKAASSDGVDHALGLIKFNEDLAQKFNTTPAQLPAYDSLNNKVGTLLTTVGYGHVNCSGPDCPPDDEVFWDDDQVNYPDWARYESMTLQDQANDPPTWWRHIDRTERRYAVMRIIPESGDWPKNGNKYLEMEQTGDKYACIDAGGPYFSGSDDPNGTLVAINFDQDCSLVTDVLRLDTPNARNFLCTKKLPELASQPLCGSGKSSVKATAANDEGSPSADNAPQKEKKDKHKKHKKGGHKGKKRGR